MTDNTMSTPKPVELDDGVILTTLEEVLRIGDGKVSFGGHNGAAEWLDWSYVLGIRSPGMVVLWRPTPERTYTIELPEHTVRAIVDDWGRGGPAAKRVVEACRAALDREADQ